MGPSFKLDLSVWETGCPLDAYCRLMHDHHQRADAWREESIAAYSPEDRGCFEELRREIASFRAEHRTLFRQGTFDQRDYPEIARVVGPVELTYLEQMRREFGVADRGFPQATSDVFVWARGEPKCRWQTKVGGLPYRPQGKPWPQSVPDAESPSHPMTFLAQFNFSESRDLFPDLPGEIVLIFAENEEFATPNALTFEWYDYGITSLVEPDEIPVPDWEFVSCFGFHHRTIDFARTEDFGLIDSRSEGLLVLPATKIGGFPAHSLDEWYGTVDSTPAGELTFLCQLNAILPRPEQYYPWLNQREPLDLKEHTNPTQTLILGDCGTVAFYLDGTGKVRWGFHTS